MVTGAEISIDGNTKAILLKDGKQLMILPIVTGRSQIKILSTAPKRDYDALNPGTRILAIEVKVPPHSECLLNVNMVSLDDNSMKAFKESNQPLAQWPKDQK